MTYQPTVADEKNTFPNAKDDLSNKMPDDMYKIIMTIQRALPWHTKSDRPDITKKTVYAGILSFVGGPSFSWGLSPSL